MVPPGADLISGVAAGGHISQKINRDPHPAWAYDTSNVTHLHLTVINAAYFTQVTGLPSPPSPISPQTYLELKLPWFSLYDEQIPTANNVMDSSPLANVESIGQMMGRDRAAAGEPGEADPKPCGYCSYELATLQLSPCGHLFCNDCANTRLCPSCGALVVHRVQFAAPMPVPGLEDGDGVEAMSLDERIIKLRADAREDDDEVDAMSPDERTIKLRADAREGGDGVNAMSLDERTIKPRADAREDGGVDAMSLDERIIKLRAGARVGKVHSFRLEEHAVAEPSGIPNLEDSWGMM